MKICIIGGGVNGLFSAWYLRKAGHAVSVVDRTDFTDNCSFGNAGFITPSHFVPLARPGLIAQGIRWMFQPDSPFYIRPRLNLELMTWLWRFYRSCNRRLVEAAMPVLLDFSLAGKQGYLDFAKETGLDFKLEQSGILMLYQRAQTELEELHIAEKAVALGLEPRVLSAAALEEFETGTPVKARGGVFYPEDAYLYPNLLMQQLRQELTKAGVAFFPKEAILSAVTEGKRVRALRSESHTFEADAYVLATGSWTALLLKKMGVRLPLQGGKGYSITLHHPPRRPRHACILVEARVAVTPMGDDLRFAGTMELSGLEPGVSRRRVQAILDSIPTWFPELLLPGANPEKAWYGYRPCTPDGLPYIGFLRKYENLLVATGHAMMGLSLGPATGELVGRFFEGDPDERYAKFFDPERFG